MFGRLAARCAVILVPSLLAAGVAPATGGAQPATGQAPGAPGAKATWQPADKTGFGTARTRASHVWYTLENGGLSDVFYPNLGTPSVRGLQLVVTDGRTFTDRESANTWHRTVRVDPRSLTYQQINTAKSGRYQIIKTYITDPARATVLVRIRFRSLDRHPYQVYALYDPSLGNDGMHDTGRTVGQAMVTHNVSMASALVASPAFGARSNGYLGTSDGWTDLATDHRLDWNYTSAPDGNVVQTARLAGVTGAPGAQDATLALGFGTAGSQALRNATASLRQGFAATSGRYAAGWHAYLGGLRRAPASVRDPRYLAEYYASVLVIAAAEDKTYPGAFIASPSEPWAWGDNDPNLAKPSAAYHLVWARDAYQFGTALLAAGDRAAAQRIVDYLFLRQQKPDGSFPQNSQVNGTPEWTNLQLDEVALPIVLAWQAGRHDAVTYAHVRKAANFIVNFRDPTTGLAAPYTPQDRWENQAGYSPATIAAEIAGLVCAAQLARVNGDPGSARTWLQTADSWQRRVEGWTVTTNGPYSSKPYYLRLTKDGNPNAGTTYSIGDGGPAAIDQRRVVDASFLDLVRLGVKSPMNPDIVSTLPVVDAQLRVQTPNGPFWHRYNFDGYGETRTGGEWHVTDPGTFQTIGRVWPILAGERGEYRLAAGRSAGAYLAAMLGAANQGGLIPEQVWDNNPPSGRPGFRPGEGTFSATPLIWSQAQFVRLAWSISAGHPVETPRVVACRYAGCPPQ